MDKNATATRIPLPYTDSVLSECVVPTTSLHHVYDLPKVLPVHDLDASIEYAIRNPIGTRQLADIVSGKHRVAIIVDDLTRPTPAARILPVVMREIHRAGVHPSEITIVMALGSHRKMTDAEIIHKIGLDAFNTYKVTQSHFDEPAHLRSIGTSADGVEIFIDEVVASADVKIGIGSIVPHGAVGWSGGGKIIYPGVAGKTTVTQFHFTHGLTEANLTGLDETSVRDRMEAWVDIVGLDFIVNSILTPDEEVYDVVAGHFKQAHRAGVIKAHDAYLVEYDTQSDVAIAVSYPHDHDFWQAGKGFYCAESMVKDGGHVILVTPCPEGVGVHSTYPVLIGRDDNVERIRAILRGEEPMPADPLPLAPAAMMKRIRGRLTLHIVSPGIEHEPMKAAGILVHPSIQAAIDHVLTLNPKATISVVRSAELYFQKRGS